MSNNLNNFFIKLDNDLAANSQKYIIQLHDALNKLNVNFDGLSVKFKEAFQSEMRLIKNLQDKLEEDNQNVLSVYYHLIRLLNIINNLKTNYCVKNKIKNYRSVIKNLTKFESWVANVIGTANCLSLEERNNGSINIRQFNQVNWLASQIDLDVSVTATANTYCNFVRLMTVDEEVKSQVESIQLSRSDQTKEEKSKALIKKLSDSGNPLMSVLEADLIGLYFNNYYLPSDDTLQQLQSEYRASISERYVEKYKTLIEVLKNELELKKYGRFRQFFFNKAYLSAQNLIESINADVAVLQRKPFKYFNDLQKLLGQTSFLDRTLRNICINYSKAIINWLLNRNVFNDEVMENIVNIFLDTKLNNKQIDQFIPSILANFINLSPEQKTKVIWRLHLIESSRGKLIPELGNFILSAARDIDINKEFNFSVPAKEGKRLKFTKSLEELILKRNTYCYQVLQQPEQTIQFIELLSFQENQCVKKDLCLDEQGQSNVQEKKQYFNSDKLNSLKSQILKEIKALNINVDELTPSAITEVTALVALMPQQLSSKIKNLLTCWHNACQLFELREKVCKENNEFLLWTLTRELTVDFIVASKVDINELSQNTRKNYQLAGRLISNLPLSLAQRFQSSKEYKLYSLEPSLNTISATKYLAAELIAENIAAKLILCLGLATKQIQGQDLSLFVKYIKEKIFLILSDIQEKLSEKIVNFCLVKITEPLSTEAQKIIQSKLSNDSKINQFEQLLCANPYQSSLTKNDLYLHQQVAEITASNKSLTQMLDQYRQKVAENDKHLQALNQRLDDEKQTREQIQREQKMQTDSRESELREQLQQANQAVGMLQAELNGVKSSLATQIEQQSQANEREHELKKQLQVVNQVAAKLQAALADVQNKLELQTEQSTKLDEELRRLKAQQAIISSRLFELETNDAVQREQNSKLDRELAALIEKKNKLDDELNGLKARQKDISDNLSNLEAHALKQREQSSKLDQEIVDVKTQQQQIVDNSLKLQTQLEDQLNLQVANFSKDQEELKKAYDQNNLYIVQQSQQTQQEIQLVKQQVEQLESFKKDFEQLKKNLLEVNLTNSKEHEALQEEMSHNDKLQISQSSVRVDEVDVKPPEYVYALREFIKVQQNFCQQIKLLYQSLLAAKKECEETKYDKYKKLIERLLNKEAISIYEILGNDVLKVVDIKDEDITQKTFSHYVQKIREAIISSDFLVVRLSNLHKSVLYYERYLSPRNKKQSTETMEFFKEIDKFLKAQSMEPIENSWARPFQMSMQFRSMFERIYFSCKKDVDVEDSVRNTLKRLYDFFDGYAATVDKVSQNNKKIIEDGDNRKFDEMIQSLEKFYAKNKSVEQTPSGKMYPAAMRSTMFQLASSENDGPLDTLKRVLTFNK